MGKTPDTAYSLLPRAALLVDLPIDHFRLLGVSPAAEPEAVLRTLQLRLDRCPDQGFTHEALSQRAELLRLSADLLTDAVRRSDYERALMELGQDHPGETAGLELAFNREVAGLILLWEANAPHEAFQLARQALQPPQAPALGSGRESDLSLLAALACRDAARQDQEQRRYEAAANLLQDGEQLLQRMGKLPDQRLLLETDLSQLLPFRILDLLSRDLAEQSARRDGLAMLEEFIRVRGGLEGSGLDGLAIADLPAGMDQGAFELFFQQIRRFLTVQEQVDLYGRLQLAGSVDASFLAAMALAAAGFTQRKPERIQDARQRLQDLVLEGLDTKPLLGCLDLLLGDVEQAERHFAASTDPELQAWMKDHPGDTLASLCEYCRTWLARDVLPGYRDVDAEAVDLETWFADRDVQAFVERLERQQTRQDPTKTNDKNWLLGDGLPLSLDPDGTLPLSSSDPSAPLSSDGKEADRGGETTKASKVFQWPFFRRSSRPKASMPELPRPGGRAVWIGSGAFVALLLVIGGLSLVGLRRDAELSVSPDEVVTPSPDDDGPADVKQEELVQPEPVITAAPEQAGDPSLRVETPSEAELEALLQTWLDRKSTVLRGADSAQELLQPIARAGLITQVKRQRAADQAAGVTQNVEATIAFMRVVSRSPKRIELRADVEYRDETLNAAGAVVKRTKQQSLKRTYILGRDNGRWLLLDFRPG